MTPYKLASTAILISLSTWFSTLSLNPKLDKSSSLKLVKTETPNNFKFIFWDTTFATLRASKPLSKCTVA